VCCPWRVSGNPASYVLLPKGAVYTIHCLG